MLDPAIDVSENFDSEQMDEHYNRYMNDEDLRNQFDYVIYNNYDENSANELLQLVEKIRGEIK